MTEPLSRPKRKNPLKKTPVPLLPQGTRSRTALGLTAAAAEGRFQLQVCGDCSMVVYPPRDACPRCLSSRLPFPWLLACRWHKVTTRSDLRHKRPRSRPFRRIRSAPTSTSSPQGGRIRVNPW